LSKSLFEIQDFFDDIDRTQNKSSNNGNINTSDESIIITKEQIIQYIRQFSETNNLTYNFFSEKITAYDIFENCILQVYYRLSKVPIQQYTDIYLPLIIRNKIGIAVHSILQSIIPFTEVEVDLFVKSRMFKGKIDAILGNSTLVEIKTVSYNDYRTIIQSKSPRKKDILQLLVYKYFIENYLDEIKQESENLSNPPKQDTYNIKTLQFLYIAYDLTSSDLTLEESVKIQQNLKRQLKSKYNSFFFLDVITINLDNDKEVLNFYENKFKKDIEEKIDLILKSIELGIEPDFMDETINKFIDTRKCYFCFYKHVCSRYKTLKGNKV